MSFPFDTAPRSFLPLLRIADRLQKAYLARDVDDAPRAAAAFAVLDIEAGKAHGWRTMPPHMWPYDHARTVESYLHAVYRGQMREALLDAQKAEMAADQEMLRREAWKANEPARATAQVIAEALEGES